MTKKFVNEPDPFNPGNKVSGWIDRDNYRHLHITHVNGEKIPQIINVTPKFHYPYTKEGDWIIPRPKKIFGVDIYKKYDGTNVCQFVYEDSEGNSYISYKTRGMLFIREDSQFYTLLNECLEKYDIEKLPFQLHLNLSYELYGYKNLVSDQSIQYDVPIDLVLLFGIHQNSGQLISPSFIKTNRVPKAEFDESLDLRKADEKLKIIRTVYNEKQKEYEESLTQNKCGTYSGHEGAMWYFHCIDDKGNFYTKAYKMKPPTILELHYAMVAESQGIPNVSLKTTIYNASEEEFPVTFDNLKSLLREEYDKHTINKNETRIKRMLSEINDEMKFQQEIVTYFKENDLSGTTGDIMRHFAEIYGKEEATRIYNTLKRFDLI